MEFVPNRFASFINDVLSDFDHSPRILDVGGGRITRIPCDESAEITVLDASPAALAVHEGPGRVVEKLIGDAQDFDYGERHFDLAVFWNVLEHVDHPEAAVARVCRQIDDRGLVVVRGPELGSLKSIIARMTPHFVHVLFYRWVLGIRDAGRNGRPPCPVRHQGSAARESLIRQLRRMGFAVRFELRYVGDQVTELRRFCRPAYWLYTAMSAVLRLLTRQRLGSRETEFILVAQLAGKVRKRAVADYRSERHARLAAA